jgi:hypothetical protein
MLIEYDRTARPHKQVDRLRRYEHFLLDGWRHTHFATHAIPPTILYITATETPLQSLIRAADKSLTAWLGPLHANPSEGVYPARQRILFTTANQLLAGHWEMRRLAGLPPSLRDPPSTTSRTVIYNCAEIFPSKLKTKSSAARRVLG